MSEEQNKKSEDSPDSHRDQNEGLKKEESEQHFPEDIHAPKQPATENMETHAHHLHKAPGHGLRHYFFEFFMLFLAVSAGYFVENLRERHSEKVRLHQYLQSMLLDVNKNISALDSTIHENRSMIVRYNSLADDLLKDTVTLDRAAFAKKLGVVWYRGFINKNETFEQMKSSGTLRYIDNPGLLIEMMQYVTATNFAQYRTEHFEEKYYTELFLPTLYKSYDLPCMYYLDTAYTNHPSSMKRLEDHIDILKGKDAEKFRQDVGGALMLRLERLRVTITAYQHAKEECNKLEEMIKKEID